jgi:hypothetical protein
MLGYHFTDGDRLRNAEPVPPVGEWLVHLGPVVPCQSGLHASEHPMDALNYAPGLILHLVELVGDLIPHGDPIDKFCGRCRRIIASIDASELLRTFARLCAMDVIGLWDAPEVVRRYLESGDEAIRHDAYHAVIYASQVAAFNAGMESVGHASATCESWVTAGSRAMNAAIGAAIIAAREIVERFAWNAAQDSANAAAWKSIGGTQEAHCWGAEEMYIYASSWAAKRDRLAQMVARAFGR